MKLIYRKVPYCPSCGMICDYRSVENDKACRHCGILNRLIPLEFMSIDILKVAEKLTCRMCGKKFDITTHQELPKFLNVYDHTYYCGCVDVTNVLEIEDKKERLVAIQKLFIP